MNKKNVVGYCDPLSVAPGESIAFKVGAYGASRYRANIVRLICGDDTPGGAGASPPAGWGDAGSAPPSASSGGAATACWRATSAPRPGRP